MNYKSLIFYLFCLLTLTSLASCQNSETEAKALKVGVYSGQGASATCILETLEALKIDPSIEGSKLSPTDIMNGALQQLDVIIFPGGSGSKEYLSMGAVVQEQVRDFVLEQGKGVVGICAGAFLLSTTEGYPSLKLSTAKVTDRPHYNRGRGLVELSMSEASKAIFPELGADNVFIQYYDGPLLVPSDSLMTYTEMARYVTDIRNRASIPEGISPGKTFILNEEVGQGRLFLIAGHPESTPGMRWMVPRMARWVARKDLPAYAEKWIKPEINDSAIVFVSELSAYEKSQFWLLCDGRPQEKIEAMSKLYDIRSRPAVRWNMGLLRDSSPEVRAYAADLLMRCEYTDAIDELKSALAFEENAQTKEKITEAIDFLSHF